jgi:hypothetical protein
MIAAALAFAALALQSAPQDGFESQPGQDARSIALDRVFPFWVEYHALPADERSAFTLDYVITLRGGDDAIFWMETADGHHVLSRDEAGAVTPPPPGEFTAARRLVTNAPEGGASVAMRLSLAGEPRERYAVAELEAAIAQADNAVRSLMGLRSLLMPRLDTVRFDFAESAPDAVVVYEDGRQMPINTVFGDVITLQPGDRSLQNAVEVRFGAAPRRAVLETAR